MEFTRKYIFGFALAVCLVCAILVCGAAVLLKDKQDFNKKIDQYTQVLACTGNYTLADLKAKSSQEIESLFNENIEVEVVNLKDGTVNTEIADPSTFDYIKYNKSDKGKLAPVNAAKVKRISDLGIVYKSKENGRIILPIYGAGLWSTLYGFLPIDEDGQTIKGIAYHTHGETPGLGGEVENEEWKSLWVDRKLFDLGKANDVSDDVLKIAVIKGKAGSIKEDPYSVDGLSGATITSNGVTNMIHFWMGENGYGQYLNKLKQKTYK